MSSPPPEIQDAISAAVGCATDEWQLLDGGRAAPTYRLTLDGEPHRAVCKIGGPSVRTGDTVEPLVLKLVEKTVDLPAPSVLRTGTLTDGTPWAVYEFREGDQPVPFRSLDATVQEQVLRDVGSILGTLHTARAFERTGGFARTEDTLLIRTPEGMDFPTRGRRVLKQVAGAEHCDWEPVLAHGDLYPGNILIDRDGTVTGVVDWGNAHVTTAGYALARAQTRFVDWFLFPTTHRHRLYTALREGYRTHRPLPVDYPAYTRFYEAVWLAQSADRIRRHLFNTDGRQRLRDHLSTALSRTNPF